MKFQRYQLFVLAAAIAAASTSCSKDTFLDVNNNPNNFDTAAPGVALTNIEVATGFNIGNDVNRHASILVQHFAALGNQVASTDAYQLTAAGFADDTWNRFYQGSIVNCNGLIQIAGRVNSPAYAGIAKLQKAYNYAVLTDLWGDVPYSQAALGLGNISPRFDKQEDIYKGNASLGVQSLFDLVREGLADLDKPVPSTAAQPSSADDPIYSGDLNKWRKMGNTLLLKMANTISRREPALANQIIKEVLAKGTGAYIVSNTEDFQVPFGSSQGNQNPIQYFNYQNRPSDQMLSQRLLDSMNVRNDLRLPYFFTPTPTRTATVNTTGTTTTIPVVAAVPPGTAGATVYTFTGYQNNSGAGVPVIANRSRAGLYQIGTNGEAPIRLITNFQRAFILAEAALTDATIGNPQTPYTEGITASMTKAGATAAQVTAYLAANPNVATLRGTNAQKQNQIITQKWIAWVGNGYEAYNDYRRTGYPRLALVSNPSGDDPTAIPARFPYPTGELTSNANNSPGAIKTNVKVWWAN